MEVVDTYKRLKFVWYSNSLKECMCQLIHIYLTLSLPYKTAGEPHYKGCDILETRIYNNTISLKVKSNIALWKW